MVPSGTLTLRGWPRLPSEHLYVDYEEAAATLIHSSREMLRSNTPSSIGPASLAISQKIGAACVRGLLLWEASSSCNVYRLIVCSVTDAFGFVFLFSPTR